MDTNGAISKKKINKRSTHTQLQHLVDQMQAFPHIATSTPVFGISKLEVNDTWGSIAESLNSIGPPERTVLEWKKTWADLKSRTKQTITENNKRSLNYRGEIWRIKTLTDLEWQIDKICHISSAESPKEHAVGFSDKTLFWPSNRVAIVTPLRSNKKIKQIVCSSSPTLPHCISTSISTLTTFSALSQQQTAKTLKSKITPYKGLTESEKELELLRKQVESQDAIVCALRSQAKSAEQFSKSLKDIAESTKLIAKTMSDLAEYLK